MSFMVILPILLFLLVVVCIAGIVWAVQGMSRGRLPAAPRGGGAEGPEDILRRRYASGDITTEQYEEMRQTLGAS